MLPKVVYVYAVTALSESDGELSVDLVVLHLTPAAGNKSSCRLIIMYGNRKVRGRGGC